MVMIRGEESFHAASTMKTPVMIEIFRQAAEGKFSMEDSIVVHNSFTSIVDGSPYQMDLGVDSHESLYGLIGEKSTYYDLTFEMITRSSNLATNILIGRVGAKNVMQTMKELGAKDIQVLRGVEDLKAFEAGLNNTTTAQDLLRIMEAIALEEVEGAEEMFNILSQQQFNDQIPALLPQDVVVAHKTGSITGVQHDSGIIRLPDGRQYILVTLSKNLESTEEGKRVSAEASRRVYFFMADGNEGKQGS
jgi:beta-lactamase class A